MRPGPRSRDGHPLVRPRTRRRHRRHRPTARRRAITAPPHQGAAAVPPPGRREAPRADPGRPRAVTRTNPGPEPRQLLADDSREVGHGLLRLSFAPPLPPSMHGGERIAGRQAHGMVGPSPVRDGTELRFGEVAQGRRPPAFAAHRAPGPDPGGRDLGGPRVSAPIDLRVLNRSALRMQAQRELGGRPRGTPRVGGPPCLPTRLRTGARRDDGSLRTRPGWARD